MRRFAAFTGAVLLVVGGGVAAFWPISFWRLFDVNLRPLALTEAENYCAGYHGIQGGFTFDDPAVTACILSGERDNLEPSVARSVGWGCQGIVAGGWGGTVEDCEMIFEQDQLWLVKDGGLTDQWSDAYPRPKAIGEGAITPADPSRTGDRQGFSRDDKPSSTTTTTPTTTEGDG